MEIGQGSKVVYFLKRLMPGNLPLRYKLWLHFLLVAILPALFLGVMTDMIVNRIIERQMNENTQQLIDKVNHSFEFYIGDVQNTSYLLSMNPQITSFLYDKQVDAGVRAGALGFMRSFPMLQTEIAGMMVVNSRGEYLSNDMYARASGNLTLERWYQEATAGKGILKVLGHPSHRKVTTHTNYQDKDVISVVRAVVDPKTQKVMGVILIDMKLRVIVEAAQDVRLAKTGYLMVMDEKGKSIYSPKQLGFDTIPLMWMKGESSGEFIEKVDGEKLQFIFRRSSFTNWSTIGVFSTSGSTPEVREIRLYIGTFVFVVCILGTTASLALSHSISRPIHRLMNFMRRAESGDLTTRYWSNSMDEIGMLGRSYNRMLGHIHELLALTEKQEKQKREAELRVLQAQIKPHFLYNTLDTIHWMSKKQGADDVSEMVGALSRLFRISLSKGREMIPLAQEFDHVESYLLIQKYRYRDKLKYTLNLDPEISQLSVLKVILQPIVENAIYHGIKERRGPGLVTISGKREGDQVLLTVSDDGKGMDADTLARLRRKLEFPEENIELDTSGSGYGLLNVQSRLQLNYGMDQAGLTIESEPGIGTTITLIYPARKED